VDNLIELFYNVDVFGVKFDKDIDKYERVNYRRRHSAFDLEIINYHEAFKPIIIEPHEHQLGGPNKFKAASLVD
jgi:hypothetical protein